MRQLFDDHPPLAAGEFLDAPACAHAQAATAAGVGIADRLGRGDELAAAGEIRSRHAFEHVFQPGLRVADQMAGGLGDFTQVVRRNLGGHADRDAGGAVEQHERQARGQQLRLFEGAVVVGDEIHRAAIDLGQQQFGDRGQAAFGVAHCRGGVAVAVHRAEVALAVDQRIAQRKVLCHPHHGVVHRGVAVGMVLTDHIADHARRLHML